MTRTEARLIDALAAVGRSVQEETLPPLPAGGLAPAPRRRRRQRWLAPLAAAASVALIVVLVSAVHLFSGRLNGGKPPAAPPRYYATVEEGGIRIRATATGAVTGSVPNIPPGHGGFGRFASAIAATDGGRAFIAAYSGTLVGGRDRTWLYSFHLTAAGRVAGLAQVRGGVFPGLLSDRGIAVSPGGSQVAVVLSAPLLNPAKPPPPAEIAVTDLRTGAQALWAGGMQRAGFGFNIASVSWAPDGRSLLFLAVWCKFESPGTEYCTAGPHDAQMRTLRLTPDGGRLTQGHVLLADSRRYPDIVQALAGPGGRSITLVELTGRPVGTINPQPQDLRVVQVPLAGGRPRLLYHAAVDRHVDVFLGSDASGRYLLLDWARNGWINHHRLRPLPPQSGLAFVEAW